MSSTLDRLCSHYDMSALGRVVVLDAHLVFVVSCAKTYHAPSALAALVALL